MARLISLGTAFLLGLAVLVPGPAEAQFTGDQRACRSAVAKAGLKLAKSSLKAISGCHKSRGSDGGLEATDCNVLASADLAGVLSSAESALAAAVEDRCTGVAPADVLYEACPAPCADDVPAVADAGDVADCLVCLNRERVEHFAQESFGSPVVPLNNEQAACHRSLVKGGAKAILSVLKAVSGCQKRTEADGATTTDECVETMFDALTTPDLFKVEEKLRVGSCAGVVLSGATFDACGNADDEVELAACVVETGRDDGQDLVARLLELPAPVPTTTTTTTTTTLPAGDPQCPTAASLTLHSRGSRIACDEDSDCPLPRHCDLGTGLCRASTDLDEGWTGMAHDADTNDGAVERVHLYCPGPDSPGCGQCTVLGLAPPEGSCRCAGDRRQECDTPFSTSGCDEVTQCVGAHQGEDCVDDTDCDAGACARRCSNDDSIVCTADAQCPGGTCRLLYDRRCGDGTACDSTADCTGSCASVGGMCECYLGAPSPVSPAGTPSCVVQHFEQDIQGSVDVDGGVLDLSSTLRTRIYLGESTRNPCPTCGGVCSDDPEQYCDTDADCAPATCVVDLAVADGLKGGTCTGGENAGEPCDVMVTNASFPAGTGASGGGSYSLDCMPDAGKNVSGAGRVVKLKQATGGDLLAAGLPCGPHHPGGFCPCLQCTGDISVPCSSNSDCSGTPSKCALAAVACGVDADCDSVDVGPCLGGILRCAQQTGTTCATNTDCQGVDAGTCDPSVCASGGGPSASLPMPNGCEALACSDTGGGEGECTTGPDESYCDGVTQADGRGVLLCNSNDDCLPASVGVDAGDCLLVERRRCFLDPIVSSGSADPEYPIVGGTACLAPTSNNAINSVLGRPGPARLQQQTSLVVECGGSGAYEPGVGCPP